MGRRWALAAGTPVVVAVAMTLSSCITIDTGARGSGAGAGRTGLAGGSTAATAGGSTATTATTATGTDVDAGTTDAGGSGKAVYPLRILTQARANPVRKAVLDAIRTDPKMGSEQGSTFVVRWLAVQNPWAMFQGETSGRNTPVEALLKNVSGQWMVMDLQKTNGRKITAAVHPSVPRGVFGPASFSLAPRDPLLILTNARGNATRKAILDALRRRFTPDTLFSVRWLRVKSGYAYIYGDAQTPGGALPFDAILKKRSWGWDVLTIQGEGDFPASIPDQYDHIAPGAIFP